MRVLADARQRLDELERALAEAPLPPTSGGTRADQVKSLRRLFSSDASEWIGTTEAKRLWGLKTKHTVRAWAKVGLLRSQTAPNGRTLVSLEDVLRRSRETHALTTPWDGPLTDEEMATLRETRPRLPTVAQAEHPASLAASLPGDGTCPSSARQ